MEVSSDRTENPKWGPEWTQPVSYDVATGTAGVDGRQSLYDPEPAAGCCLLTRAAMGLTRSRYERCSPTRHRRATNWPMTGVITRHPEEPYVNSTRTVL